MQHGKTKALAAALSIAILSAASAASALITDERFEKKTQEELERLEVPAEDVVSVKIVLIRGGDRRGPKIRGAEGWVRLSFCSGHLVVVMNRAAFAREVYTRGDCSIPGLKSR